MACISHRASFIPGLTCKACSLDVLGGHEWQRKSTDALNNNLKPDKKHDPFKFSYSSEEEDINLLLMEESKFVLET